MVKNLLILLGLVFLAGCTSTGVFVDDGVTNVSVFTGEVINVTNVTNVTQNSLWELTGSNNSIRINDFAYNNINMNNGTINNITYIGTPDGSAITFGNLGIFTGLDKAINIYSNQMPSAGSAVHVLTEENTIIRAWQNGIPNGAGFMRNSQIIGNDFNSTNATLLMNCEEYILLSGDEQRIACNTSMSGADLYVQGSVQIGNELFIEKNFESRGIFLHDGENNASNTYRVLNTNAQFTSKINTETIIEGGNFTDFINWDGVATGNDITPFNRVEQIGTNANNWRLSNNGDCPGNPCARARGGDSSAPRKMEYLYSTENATEVNVEMFIFKDNSSAVLGDNLSVYLSDDNLTFTRVFYESWVGGNMTSTAENVSFSFPPQFINKSSIQFQIWFGATDSSERAFVDNINLTKFLITNTSVNITGIDANIVLGEITGNNVASINVSTNGNKSMYINSEVINLNSEELVIRNEANTTNADLCIRSDGTIYSDVNGCTAGSGSSGFGVIGTDLVGGQTSSSGPTQLGSVSIGAGIVNDYILISYMLRTNGASANIESDLRVGESGSETSVPDSPFAVSTNVNNNLRTIEYYYEPTTDEKTNGFNVQVFSEVLSGSATTEVVQVIVKGE